MNNECVEPHAMLLIDSRLSTKYVSRCGSFMYGVSVPSPNIPRELSPNYILRSVKEYIHHEHLRAP
jgi:hypothetical protein